MNSSLSSPSVPGLVAEAHDSNADALAAWTGFMRAAQMLKSTGSFAGLASLVPYPEINELFAASLPGHQVRRR